MNNPFAVSETELPADVAQLLMAMQQRIDDLERENADLRQQVEQGFRETVLDFSNSILATIDPLDPMARLDDRGKPIR